MLGEVESRSAVGAAAGTLAFEARQEVVEEDLLQEDLAAPHPYLLVDV